MNDDLGTYIKENFKSKQAFADFISSPKKTISRQQVSRWVFAECKWIDGNVWRNASKLTAFNSKVLFSAIAKKEDK